MRERLAALVGVVLLAAIALWAGRGVWSQLRVDVLGEARWVWVASAEMVPMPGEAVYRRRCQLRVLVPAEVPSERSGPPPSPTRELRFSESETDDDACRALASSWTRVRLVDDDVRLASRPGVLLRVATIGGVVLLAWVLRRAWRWRA